MQFLEDRNLTFREAEINRKRNTLPLHNRYWKRPSAARFNCNITPPNARPENGQAERHTTDGGLRSIGFPVAWASSPPGRVIMGAKRVNGLKLSDTKSGSRYLKKKRKQYISLANRGITKRSLSNYLALCSRIFPRLDDRGILTGMQTTARRRHH